MKKKSASYGNYLSDIYLDTLAWALKAIQVIPNQESLRNRHNQNSLGLRKLNVKWYWFVICDKRAMLIENVYNKPNWP